MKSALIFGGKSPLATAIAEVFAANGFDICLIARNSASLADKVAATETLANSRVTIAELDISQRESLEQFAASYENNCPDVVISVLGRQEPTDIQRDHIGTISDLIEGNLTGPASVLELFASVMQRKGSGTLIGISSVAGERGRQKNYTYGSAKAGFTAFLSGLRNRLSDYSVHVITVVPGVIQTDASAPLNHPSWLVRKPDVLANDVYKAYLKRKNTVYTPWFWAWIMLIIKLIPEPIFKRLNI